MKYISYFCVLVGLSSCSVLLTQPDIESATDRLREFPQHDWPIEKSVTIRWQDHMIPFIEAETDGDCAFALGMVQAHLRLGQMELFRRLTAGRVAESAGPYQVTQIDHALRTLDLGRTGKESFANMPEADQKWLSRFVDGVNFYIDKSNRLPVEYDILNWEKERWNVEDAMRIARMASLDITWMNYISFLGLRNEEGWRDLWQWQIHEADRNSVSIDTAGLNAFQQLLPLASRSGSNSLVVSRKKTGGGAMIANDPHLGIFAPNLWVLMGYRSPSYHVLGFMIPGIPTVAVGRNPEVSWGGTNMRGISSHLFRVNEEQITSTREETIKTRWWFDTDVTIRESVHGPIISDWEFIESEFPIALKWVGHQPSQEVSSFLAVNRAKNYSEFRNAWKGYAVSGQNMTYADKDGNIGMALALSQPILKKPEEMDMLIKSADNDFVEFRDSLKLPHSYNPEEGFIASANNRPFGTEPRLAYSYSHSDRMDRWRQLLKQESVNMEDLKKWQLDVLSLSAIKIRDEIIKRLPVATDDVKSYYETLANWNGEYKKNMRGPVAFEVLGYTLANKMFSEHFKSELLKEKVLNSDNWRILILELFAKKPPAKETILAAFRESKASFDEIENWEQMHRQTIQHPLGNFPLIGGRFRYHEYGTDGAATTINKSASRPGTEVHGVFYGAQARHVSDMSDPDENYFVLLGGNDGWINNPHIADQVELWRRGDYIKLPMSEAAVKEVYALKVMTVEAGRTDTTN